MAEALSGNNQDRVLRNILDELNELKANQNQARNVRADPKYKYLDDKTLYSTDG